MLEVFALSVATFSDRIQAAKFSEQVTQLIGRSIRADGEHRRKLDFVAPAEVFDAHGRDRTVGN
jgi:hypothetical protein